MYNHCEKNLTFARYLGLLAAYTNSKQPNDNILCLLKFYGNEMGLLVRIEEL